MRLVRHGARTACVRERLGAFTARRSKKRDRRSITLRAEGSPRSEDNRGVILSRYEFGSSRRNGDPNRLRKDPGEQHKSGSRSERIAE